MTGRWLIASVQMSFTIMPALIYVFAGHWVDAVSLGTVIAFTTLQARLMFPVTALLGISIEVQASLALFRRIFQWLDVDIELSQGVNVLSHVHGDVAFDRVWFRYEEGVWTLQDVTFTAAAGTKTAIVGETGSGKTTIGYLVARL